MGRLKGKTAWMASGVMFLVLGGNSLAEEASTEPGGAWARRMEGVEKFEVGTLGVERFGEGERVMILVPGLGGGSWVWEEMIKRFLKAGGWRVYVVTLAGFDGRKGVEERPLVGAFVRDFWKLLEEKKIQKPVVMGHSLGGTLAIMLAEEHAERLGGIVVVDGLPMLPAATKEQRASVGEQLAKGFEGLSGEALYANQKEYMAGQGTLRAELVEAAARQQARSDGKMMGAWIREMMKEDLRPGLGKVTVPFLVIAPYGGAGGYTREQVATFYKEQMAGAPRVRVEGVGPSRHFVMLDQGEAFGKVVEGFLKEGK